MMMVNKKRWAEKLKIKDIPLLKVEENFNKDNTVWWLKKDSDLEIVLKDMDINHKWMMVHQM